MRAPWDFGYAPVAKLVDGRSDVTIGTDVVVATTRRVRETRLADALARSLPDSHVNTVIARAPVFWYRLRSTGEIAPEQIARLLSAAGVVVRYVAAARGGSYALGVPLELERARPARASSWAVRAARPRPDASTPGRWFLGNGPGGVDVDRARCGTGAGVRLAVIDDDAMAADLLPLDAEILVGADHAARAQMHGSLVVGWAVGTRAGFAGVAPDASPRLYLVPKPGVDVVSLPLAILRAVLDGADVLVCATYVEGTTSPMLDDALEVAAKLGRRGRGAAIVLPTGREASSVGGSLHASWSLGFGDPASDPRVFCIGPGGSCGGWFFWRNARGKSSPFGNRGPAVRWLAPGDDLPFPFTAAERLCHAESSGASAVAAGVLCLVLGQNASLRLVELEAVVTRTLSPVRPSVDPAHEPLADPADALPVWLDRDGHNAKSGYGLLNASRACISVSDAVAAALTGIGDDRAARRWTSALASGAIDPPCSPTTSRWIARAMLRDETTWHVARAIARHARLVAAHPERAMAHGAGAWTRQLSLLVRRLESAAKGAAPARAQELAGMRARLDALLCGARERLVGFERELQSCATRVVGGDDESWMVAPKAGPDPDLAGKRCAAGRVGDPVAAGG